MSTRYISALLAPDAASTVLRVGLGRAQRGQQLAKLLIVGATQPVIAAQQLPLLNPLPWHAVRLLTGTVSLRASRVGA